MVGWQLACHAMKLDNARRRRKTHQDDGPTRPVTGVSSGDHPQSSAEQPTADVVALSPEQRKKKKMKTLLLRIKSVKLPQFSRRSAAYLRRTNPLLQSSTNTPEKALTTMAGHPVESFRLLDLPPELRMLVYDHIFSGSTIKAVWNYLRWPPKPFINLKNYHWATTLTSKFVQQESRPSLFAATTFVISTDAVENPFYLPPNRFKFLEPIERIRFLTSDHRNYWREPLEEVIALFPNLRTLECCINYNSSRVILGKFQVDKTLSMFSTWQSRVLSTTEDDALKKALKVRGSPVAFEAATKEWMEGRYRHAAALLLRRSSFKMKMVVVAQYPANESAPPWGFDDDVIDDDDLEVAFEVRYDVLFAEVKSALTDNKCSILSWFMMGITQKLVM